MAISDFPNLQVGAFEITSARNAFYNCAAWVANDSDNWWWPDLKDSYWPPDAPREETREAFESAYATVGYERCDDSSFEDDFEKIAIYVNDDGPQHVARQLPDTQRWTSKLGPDEDITHDTLDALSCDLYGEARWFLRRPKKGT